MTDDPLLTPVQAAKRKGSSVFWMLAVTVWIFLLAYFCTPLQYEHQGRQYLCWRIPGGEACVEVFHR